MKLFKIQSKLWLIFFFLFAFVRVGVHDGDGDTFKYLSYSVTLVVRLVTIDHLVHGHL